MPPLESQSSCETGLVLLFVRNEEKTSFDNSNNRGLFFVCVQIDPAFEHFENLTELDLGRNRLRVLENLPEGLVSLSCAANELSGENRFSAYTA